MKIKLKMEEGRLGMDKSDPLFSDTVSVLCRYRFVLNHNDRLALMDWEDIFEDSWVVNTRFRHSPELVQLKWTQLGFSVDLHGRNRDALASGFNLGVFISVAVQFPELCCMHHGLAHFVSIVARAKVMAASLEKDKPINIWQ